MKRLSSILTIAILLAMGSVISVAQEADVSGGGGTVRGTIEDTTTARAPIPGVEVIIKDVAGTEYKGVTDDAGEYEITNLPSGRYFVSVYKDGYGDRVGKPVNVVAGGDRYFPLKMTKKDDTVFFFQKMGFLFWPLALGAIIVLAIIIGGLTLVLSKRDSDES
jgi:hypothetical protein